MIGSKDDIQDMVEVNEKIFDILEEFFREDHHLHPASVFSGIYFYFLCILPEEQRDALFDNVEVLSACSVGNELMTAKDRKKFYKQCQKYQDKFSR